MPLNETSLADLMQGALPGVWEELNPGKTFPGDPTDKDQKVLFRAIARGLLQHLAAQDNDMISSLRLGLVTHNDVSVTFRNI